MWIAVLLVLLLASPAFAGEASLGEIIVTPSAPVLRPSGREDLSLSSTTIDRKEFEQKKTSVGEVLSESAGVQIRRYGGLDDFATVSIRGATSEQVAVYLDGLLLNSAEGGGVNLATIPTDQIEKIEVYRGAVPSTLGSSPMGGAVFIRTKKSEGRQTRISGSYGSFNTIDSAVSQSERFQSSSYAADYHFSRSDGDFSFTGDNGTPLNPNDDRTLVRNNNEFQRHQLILKAGSALRRDSELAFQEILFREDRGIPGPAGFSSVEADFSTTRSMTKIDWTEKNWGLSPFFTFQKQQFTDLRGEIGLGFRDNDNDTFSYGTDSRAMFLLGSHQRLTFSGNYRGEQFLPEDFISTTASAKSVRNQGAIGLEDEVVLLDERLIVNPSIRSEHIVSHFSSTESILHPVSGKVGVRWVAAPRLHFRSSFARAYRTASFSELFGDRGRVIGNPSLSPEKGWNWDAGYRLKTDFFSIESSYYLNHSQDLIQVLQTSQLTARAENLRSARIQGIETTLVLPLASFADLSNNYTFQLAKDTSGLPGTAGKSLPGRPQHEAVSKMSLFNRWGKVYSSLEFIDGNFLDTQNLLRVNNRLLLGSGISWTPVKKATLSLDAKNLLNDRISDVVGFPLPGRSFYGKVDLAI